MLYCLIFRLSISVGEKKPKTKLDSLKKTVKVRGRDHKSLR